MEIFNTINYQKQFLTKDPQYKNTQADLYLTKFLNNYFRALSIIYTYPYRYKPCSILTGFDKSYNLDVTNKIFTLNITSGMIVLDSVLIEISENFSLTLDDISISNYKYCNILFTVEFNYFDYQNDKNKVPVYRLFLYDSITGKIADPNGLFNVSKVIILETYSIYHRNGRFKIEPYFNRMKPDETFDLYNYIYIKPIPNIIPKPYPNVDNDNPDYTHTHLLKHNHTFANEHDHNSDLELVNKYYYEQLKLYKNTIPPPDFSKIKNNILILDEYILNILDFNLPLNLELFNFDELPIAGINNLSFDFRYIDPNEKIIADYNANKYDYSAIRDYGAIERDRILINSLKFPIRVHRYFFYILRNYIPEDNLLERYSLLFEDNILNYGCFC